MEEKRNKVEEHRKELEDKSVLEYRRAVAQSKRQLKQQLEGKQIELTKQRAREELMAKSAQREKINSTSLVEDRNNRIDTLRTLESVEAKV